jgi:hypothetical protein
LHKIGGGAFRFTLHHVDIAGAQLFGSPVNVERNSYPGRATRLKASDLSIPDPSLIV